jgi:methyl-accepting chemotaxis protein
MRFTDEVKESIKSTLGMITTITEISKTSAIRIEEISSESEKVYTQTEKVNQVSTGLSDMAKEMRGATAQFNIDGKKDSLMLRKN